MDRKIYDVIGDEAGITTACSEDFGVAEVRIVYEETQSVHVYRRGTPEFFIYESSCLFESSLGLTIEMEELFL